MKYSELITFQPIESVIQLRDANRQDSARKLVSSYVISTEMCQRLSEVVIPHLQYGKPHDNKGLLIVGNYGTGKSHLLSVLSSVAENADLLPLISNPTVLQAAASIAGKFKVIRLEIGSTLMPFQEIITSALEKHLADWGVSFQFPDTSKQYENKTAFENMMGAFHKKFPDHGLLLVVDELLDYLRSRHDQPLILDLGFLRELGEVCKDLRFRFVAGVQEAIFDSGRFAHVASSLGRVKDRFQQVRIASTDVQYVVANRLLKKSPQQLSHIRDYLQPFAKFYANMNERMDDFAELFPIHPDYIETFEHIPIVEKRGVLQIISDTIKKLVSQEIPADRPGVEAFDSYWKALIENPANKAIPEVAAIIECSDVLAAKIKNAYTKPPYRAMALRIVDALSVHRLTTHDPYAPIGLTPEELRDGLCLYHAAVATLPGDPAANLLTVVETALNEIRRTVSGQFISFSKDNRQFFLDLKKVDDFDALVEKRAEALDSNVLDRYYYDALRQVLECTDAPSFTGWQIWQHEIVWKERQAPRLGYLFFGTPSERSTAIPPRDFYFYFVQPYDPPRFTDDKLPDELFFRLSEKDQAFDDSLKFYAAALELAATSSGAKKDIYGKKATEHLGAISKWMHDHLLANMDVTHQGQKKKLTRWLQGRPNSGGMLNIRDTVNAVGSACLAEHFYNQSPNYPTFSLLLTTRTLTQAAQDAVRGIAQPATRTKQATAALDALELLDGDKLEPARSQYAKHIIDLLKTKGQGQVLNRQELIQPVNTVDYFVPDKYRLETEWAVVLLASLVYSGDVVLTIPGAKFDATGLNTLATTSIEELKKFKHVERPKDWNLPALKALFELMDLAPGLAVEVTQGSAAPVTQLHKTIMAVVERLVLARQQLLNGIPFWGQNLFTEPEMRTMAETLDAAKTFVESLQAYNTPGKLKNFKYDVEEISAQRTVFDKLKEIQEIEAFAREIGQCTQYLSMAEGYLPDTDPWALKSKALREQLVKDVRKPENRVSPKFKSGVIEKLKTLKSEYAVTYLALHKRARLSRGQDQSKSELAKDYRVAQLQRLTAIDLLNRQQLLEFQDRLGRLKTCFALTDRDLEADPKCPHCGFWPSMEPSAASADAILEAVKTDLGKIQKNWTQSLLGNLEDPVVQGNFGLLKPKQRKLLEEFAKQAELPDEITNDFLQALQEALSGLAKVPVRLDDLKSALFPDGSPTTPSELRDRFENFVSTLLKGKDADKTRIVLE
ncbi:MAG: DUF6079 family protein [Kiritimatiellae bacterium]|nr:DUF6079 family protein [Kiritimatiellia bacterium]